MLEGEVPLGTTRGRSVDFQARIMHAVVLMCHDGGPTMCVVICPEGPPQCVYRRMLAEPPIATHP